MAFISGADSSLISVSLVLYPWALHRRALAALSWQSPSGRVLIADTALGGFFIKDFFIFASVERSCPKGFVPLEMGDVCVALPSLCSALVRAAWACL